jgi:hypothetical protein
MADDSPSGDRVAKEWPLEGHLIVGGSGLFVTTDCLGRAFASRTASYDLTIGLPQLDPGSTSYGPTAAAMHRDAQRRMFPQECAGLTH